MRYQLGYGKSKINVNIPNEYSQNILTANSVCEGLTGIDEIKRAVINPIGTDRLSNIVKEGEKIVIITSDITRPMPSYLVLPEILNELYLGGIKKEDIIIVFALGSHRSHSEDEMRGLAGSVYDDILCIDSNGDDCVMLGYTDMGTPVEIFKPVVEADRRIALGNIEYHYFAGYSGGYKAVMPGVSNNKAIQHNHSKMVDKNAFAGNIDNNPVRCDIEQVSEFISLDFICNVVLDENKKVVYAAAGHPVKAHRQGCLFLDGMYKCNIKNKADIVIVSAGGYPKDINLYQAQKALDNAKHAVRENGIIILAAECSEGLGEKTFENWLINAECSQSLIERISVDFRLGGHKAAAIAMVLENAEIFLVSNLDKKLAEDIFLIPFDSVDSALEAALKKIGSNAEILVIPYGGSVLPSLL